MSFHVQLWLLATLCAVAADYTSYIPQVTGQSFQGKVTTTTFILDKPQCLFPSDSSLVVWLIVANQTVQLDNNNLPQSAPYYLFSSSGYYRTLRTTADTYPCTSVAGYIRVGNESYCSDINNCNGPLPSSGPYRVKFVVLNSAGSLVGQTGWSAPITLRQGKMTSVIDTWPGRRSGGMIVITSILSVLLATFLLCLIGTFIVGRKNIICCKKTDKIETPVLQVPQALNMKDYRTHIAPENLDIDLYSKPTS